MITPGLNNGQLKTSVVNMFTPPGLEVKVYPVPYQISYDHLWADPASSTGAKHLNPKWYGGGLHRPPWRFSSTVPKRLAPES